MKFKNTIFVIILSFLAALFFSAPLRAADKTEPPSPDVESFLPVWALEQHELTVVSVAPMVVGDQTLGAVTVYDDATTERPADYWEFYDSEGHLLAASWFDRLSRWRQSGLSIERQRMLEFQIAQRTNTR